MGLESRGLTDEDRKEIFGLSFNGPIEEQAKKSKQLFVRSVDHLAVFNSKSKATGQKLTAFEVIDNFGERCFEEILDYGSALLVSDSDAGSRQPGMRIQNWRQQLKISVEELANWTGIDVGEIKALEDNLHRVPAKNMGKICRALSLNEYKVGLEDLSREERALGYRFKQLQSDRDLFGEKLTEKSAISLLEDAWLISKQNSLSKKLGENTDFRSMFTPEPNYGSPGCPAWKIGYQLANKTRELLGIPADEPIENLRELIEKTLKIPLIYDELAPSISGATVQIGNDRGIVVNVKGNAFNTWSTRLTIAHELGHLLWDPDQNLKSLIVDRHEIVSSEPWSEQYGYEEQRANAFAIELLAPQSAIMNRFSPLDDAPENIFGFMDEFGVSYTAAKYHIWNAMDRVWDLEEIKTESVDASSDWEGREIYLATFIPGKLNEAGFPTNRRGQFLKYVVDAQQQNLISTDTAALYLGIDESVLREVHELREQFY